MRAWGEREANRERGERGRQIEREGEREVDRDRGEGSR